MPVARQAVADCTPRKRNFAGLFDAAHAKIRAWGKANPGPFRVERPAVQSHQ